MEKSTDGDTAQVGPQIAERLNLPQTSYCEDFKIENDKVIAKRVVEGGFERVKMEMPALITVANSYHPLEYKSLRGARMVQHLLRNESEKAKYIKTITLDDIGADPMKCGLKGSPTIVARTDKVSEIGGSCKIHQGHSPEQLVMEVINDTNILEFVNQ